MKVIESNHKCWHRVGHRTQWRCQDPESGGSNDEVSTYFKLKT